MKLVRFDGDGVAIIRGSASVLGRDLDGFAWLRGRQQKLTICCLCKGVKLPGSLMWSTGAPSQSHHICDWCLKSKVMDRSVCSCGSFSGFSDSCTKCGGHKL